MSHTISNVDAEARTGDCAECGPGVRVRPKPDGHGRRYWRCRTSDRVRSPGAKARQKQAARARGGGQWRQPNHRRYGLTDEEFAELVAVHGGGCAICGEDRRLIIDHCHREGTVRGLLCYACNTGLGQFGDDPERLRAAIAYLTR